MIQPNQETPKHLMDDKDPILSLAFPDHIEIGIQDHQHTTNKTTKTTTHCNVTIGQTSHTVRAESDVLDGLRDGQ